MRSILMLTLLMLIPLSLSGCGLTPVYATKSHNSGTAYEMAQIEIASIPEKSGLDLRNELIDRLYRTGKPAYPKYRLTISPITEVKAGLGIAKDASVTRSQLRQRSTLTLVNLQSNKAVLIRNINAVTSYNVLDSHFTTLVSEKEARKNGLMELAEQVVLQLDLYLSSQQRQVQSLKPDADTDTE